MTTLEGLSVADLAARSVNAFHEWASSYIFLHSFSSALDSQPLDPKTRFVIASNDILGESTQAS